MSDSSKLDEAREQHRRINRLLIVSLSLSAVAVALAAAATFVASGLVGSDPPQASFEDQARAYILANPETIVEAMNLLEARQKQAEASEATAVLTQRRDEIFNDPAAPVAGNLAGDVTLVEFFDYNCPYCRKAVPVLEEVRKTDPGLRLVFKEFPILGPGSTFAARAALASRKQDKYLAFHKAMMSYTGSVTESSALQIAVEAGLDVERLKKDMEDPEIGKSLERNLALAQDLRINGTPGFVVGNEILHGLVDVATMNQSIAKAREK